jgi:hypothetical protein
MDAIGDTQLHDAVFGSEVTRLSDAYVRGTAL